MAEQSRSALLQLGDQVALVSPAGPTAPGGLDYARQLLTAWNYRVRVIAPVEAGYGYLADTDDGRLGSFQAAWDDPRIRAIFCLRGGYGSQRIANDIQWRGPTKPIVGFSDITTLQLALWNARKAESVHGPCIGVSAAGLSEASAESLRRVLTSVEQLRMPADDAEPTFTLRDGSGTVTGPLLGGNLSIIATSVGTRTCPSFAGSVLLLEDVDEAPYRIDRMLTYLSRLGAFADVAAVVLGRFTNCVSAQGPRPDVVDVLRERLTTFGVRFLGGLPVGHGANALAVPYGREVEVDFNSGVLTFAPRRAGQTAS